MEQAEFKTQMARLANRWRAVYVDELVKLIWLEVNNLPPGAFGRMVDHFIGCCRHAPLLPEIREEASAVRERMHQADKERNRREAETSIQQHFEGDFIRSICKNIRGRMDGKVSDQKFQEFTQGIRKISGVRCQRCSDEGLVFLPGENGVEAPYRCLCPSGERHPARYPRLEPEKK